MRRESGTGVGMGELIGAFALGMTFAIGAMLFFTEAHSGPASFALGLAFPLVALAGMVILLIQSYRRLRDSNSA